MKLTALALSFCVFLCSLMPNSDLRQLVNLIETVEHYFQHRAEAQLANEPFSLLDFITDHFVNPDSHQHDDHSEHQKLPFQSFQSPLNFIVSSFDDEPSQAVTLLSASTTLFYHNAFHLDGFKAVSVRPPLAH